ncbi:MAG: RagB/SusD family nutrient uptake outer membrane protein [Ginsengibacter sp.]
MNKPYSFLKLFLHVAVLIVIGISCKKYIYQAPITSTYGAEFWTSQQSVEQASLAMYGQLRADFRLDRSFFINGDLTSGAFVAYYPGWWNYAPISTHNPYAGGNFNFSYVPYLTGSLQNWSRFYQLIAQSNLILQNVPEMSSSVFSSEDVRNAYLGEALFMRAYTYFYIVRAWGDPVYVTKTYNDVDYGNIPPLPRTPESLVLDSCISDLKKAAGYLGYVGGDPSKVLRANRATVYALLAHIYAWKHDYPNAHLACQEVMNKGSYSLEPMDSYKNIWKGQSSSENIWELSMQYNPNDPNFSSQGDWAEAQFNFFGTTFLKGPIVDNVSSDSWVSPSGGFVDQFFDTTNDARFKQSLKYVNASGSAGNGYLLTKYTDFNYQKPDSKTLPYINNNLVLYRLSDIILLDAEALAYTGDLAGAAHDLSYTEDRAGISTYNAPTNQYDMVDEIVIERGRELIGEGQWFYDLIRTEKTQGWLEYVGYQSDRVTEANKGYYWPLDMGTLFPQDNLLTQNPWWATHK